MLLGMGIGHHLGSKLLFLLCVVIWLTIMLIVFNVNKLALELPRRTTDSSSHSPQLTLEVATDDGEVLPGAFDFSAMVNANATFRLPTPRGLKRDWHDYAAMAADKRRVGLGEQGVAAHILDKSLHELERNMSLQNGLNALLSDSISVNRSLPEERSERCQHKRYLAKLPHVSIVIPSYNEHLSVLKRTLHSIVNRTPPELLKQIILVDDCSDRVYLPAALGKYIKVHFRKNLVKLVRLSQRTGLIGARLAGARYAHAHVLVFVDSHVECSHNWLPPLLEPIALNRKIATCPLIDIIAHDNFGYLALRGRGVRGIFNWNMKYTSVDLLPSEGTDPTQPYRNAVMMGGAFAIERKFFWELGGYDEQLDIWGGEQYELSFKIWMCGGMLINVPCSRVAHVFRGPMNRQPNQRNGSDFTANNYKRVAEVWMDEYAKYVLKRERHRYDKAKTGDVRLQLAVRERLQCKSFKWFLEMVAPDLLKRFPPMMPPNYATGAVQSVAYPTYCLDSMNHKSGQPVGLFTCANNKKYPHLTQFWDLSHFRDMRVHDQYCLDVHGPNTTVWLWTCHGLGGNQLWYYHRKHMWLVQGSFDRKCMEAVRTKTGKMLVQVDNCNVINPGMKWRFGSVNNTALDGFFKELEP